VHPAPLLRPAGRSRETPLTEYITDPATQAGDIWERTLADLRLQTARATFDSRLRGTWPLAWDPAANTWIIGVTNSHSVEWLRHRLAKVVQRSLAHHTEGQAEPQITFVAALPPPGEGKAGWQPGPTPHQSAARSEPQGGDPGPDRQAGGDRSDPGQRTGAPPPHQGSSEPATRPALKHTDIYVKLKVCFRHRLLRLLKGPKLSVFACLMCHLDSDNIAHPGVSLIMRETGLARSTVCSALDELCSPRFRVLEKLPSRGRGPNRYRVLGYAWFGSKPAPALYEEEDAD